MAPRRSLLVLSLFAATSALTAAACPALAAEPTIALVQINQQALFFTHMNEGAEKTAKEPGAKLVIFNANNDPAAQNSAIETYIAEKVDGLIVVAIDVNGIMPAVQAAADAGIPVVAIDAILPAARRRRRSASTTRRPARDRQVFRRLRGGERRQGQGRRRRRARTPSSRTSARRASRTSSRRPRASPSPASSTGRTSRTTRWPRPRT